MKTNVHSDWEGYGRMEKAQVPVPLVGTEPANPFVRGGSLE